MSPIRFHIAAAGLACALVCMALGPRPSWATAPPLSGSFPDAMIQAFHDGILRLDPPPRGLPTTMVTTTWRVPIILVSFSDDSLRYTARDFERLLFDTTHAVPTGSAAEYYR